MLFYLIENGVSPSFVYGYHSGWPFDRLVRMFRYLKRREIELRREQVMNLAIGASAVVTNRPLKKFINEIDSALGEMKEEIEEDGDDKVRRELGKLMGFLGGVQSR